MVGVLVDVVSVSIFLGRGRYDEEYLGAGWGAD